MAKVRREPPKTCIFERQRNGKRSIQTLSDFSITVCFNTSCAKLWPFSTSLSMRGWGMALHLKRRRGIHFNASCIHLADHGTGEEQR